MNRLIFVIFLIFYFLITQNVYSEDLGFFVKTREIKFMVDEKPKSKDISILGLKNNTSIDIIAGDLIDKKTGNIINHKNIFLNNTSSSRNIIVNEDVESIINVLVNSNSEGHFEGYITLVEDNNSNSTFNIPIKIESSTQISKAIIIFVVGFIISGVFWMWRERTKISEEFENIKKKARELYLDTNSFYIYTINPELYLMRIINYILQATNEFTNYKLVDSKQKIDKANEVYLEMLGGENLNHQEIRNAAATNNMELYDFVILSIKKKREFENNLKHFPPDIASFDINFNYCKYLANNGLINKIIINLSAIIIGLIIGIGSLLQQDFINNLRTLDVYSGVVIFGIGFGIENIKRILENLLTKSS